MGLNLSSTLDNETDSSTYNSEYHHTIETTRDAAKQRSDVFSLWPQLENQLEVLFRSLDRDGKGTLPYASLEPVLRHQLMQIGLIEYVTRFANPNGSLNEEYIASFLNRYNLDLSCQLDLTDWKNLMLCWIQRVQEAQETDVENWQHSINELQKTQASKYQQALSDFQNLYLQHLERYYCAIDASHKKEEEYRLEWENSLGLQEQFYATQLQFIKQQEENTATKFEEKMRMSPGIESKYFEHVGGHKSVSTGNIKTITLVYPASVTSNGAPVSGGAQLPSRRLRTKPQKKQGCL